MSILYFVLDWILFSVSIALFGQILIFQSLPSFQRITLLVLIFFVRKFLRDNVSTKASSPNTWVLLTGASTGIGFDLAKLFAKDGYNLVIVARNEKKLKEVKQTLLSINSSIDVRVLPKDLSNINAPKEILNELEKLGIGIDILVNNAAFGSQSNLWEMKEETIVEMVQCNINSLTHLTRLILPNLVKKKFGRILNVASTVAFQPGPSMTVYSASKAYVLLFSEGLTFELKDTGVTCTALCPGATRTEFASRAGNDKSLIFKSGVATSADVALDGYRAMMRGDRRIISGYMNWCLAFLSPFFPVDLNSYVVKFLLSETH